jgi:hypothetical protein
MMLLPSLLFIAQSTLLPLGAIESSEARHPTARSSRHGHPTPSPTPQVRITIVNATCEPAISLTTTGTNPLSYPLFPQGEWTGNEPLQTTELHYLARTTNGTPLADRTIRFKPVSSQFLLLTGDLSRSGPAEKLPQLGTSRYGLPGSFPPNFQFNIYPLELVCADPCHYRVVNAMPSKTLVLKTFPEGNKPARQLGILTPGNSLLLVGQPPSVEWVAEIDGTPYPLQIVQEGAEGNCLVPFFLREGKPTFIRVFEAP